MRVKLSNQNNKSKIYQKTNEKLEANTGLELMDIKVSESWGSIETNVLKKIQKGKLKKLKTNQFKIILTQGLNRQIRRMCNYFDFKVVSLVRTRIMNIKLDIPEGKYRLLNENEIKSLKNKI